MGTNPFTPRNIYSAYRTAKNIVKHLPVSQTRKTNDRFNWIANRQRPFQRKKVTWKATPGKYMGKFAKTKFKKFTDYKQFNREGVIIKVERGNVVEDNIRDSIYIGHGMAYETTLTALIMALVKHVAQKSFNYTIVNWQDTILASLMHSVSFTDNVYFWYKVKKTLLSDIILAWEFLTLLL